MCKEAANVVIFDALDRAKLMKFDLYFLIWQFIPLQIIIIIPNKKLTNETSEISSEKERKLQTEKLIHF